MPYCCTYLCYEILGTTSFIGSSSPLLYTSYDTVYQPCLALRFAHSHVHTKCPSNECRKRHQHCYLTDDIYGFSVHMEAQTLMVHVMCTIGTSNIYNEFQKCHQCCYLTNLIYVALPLQEGTESDGTYDV